MTINDVMICALLVLGILDMLALAIIVCLILWISDLRS